MEKMITIFTEVAVATIILFGLVALSTGMMDAGTYDAVTGAITGGGIIYSGLHELVSSIFDAAKDAALTGMPVEG